MSARNFIKTYAQFTAIVTTGTYLLKCIKEHTFVLPHDRLVELGAVMVAWPLLAPLTVGVITYELFTGKKVTVAFKWRATSVTSEKQ